MQATSRQRWLRRSVDVALALSVFGGLVVGAGCVATTEPTILDSQWDEVAKFYAEARTSTTDPFLSMNPSAGSADKFQTPAGQTSGVSAGVGRIQGSAPGAADVWNFPGDEKLAKDYYLNVSKPVVGTLWLTDSVSQAIKGDGVAIRVELFAGANRIGGQDFRFKFITEAYTSGQLNGAWIHFDFKFQPEVLVLPAGESLSLRVTRLSGGFDLAFGTGGAQQSFVEFHYFSFNPLGSTVYLEGGKIFFGSPGTDASDFQAGIEDLRAKGVFNHPGSEVYVISAPNKQASPVGLILVLGMLVPPMLLVSLRTGRSRATALATLLVVAGVLGGCLGAGHSKNTPGSGGATDQPSPTASTTYVANETLKQEGHGAVKGLVRDEHNLTMAKVHIALLGTIFFMDTTKEGTFEFDNVSAGKYILRVDASGFIPLEQKIEVHVGETTTLDVRLVRPLDLGMNKQQHFHDYWAGESSKTYPEVVFLPPSNGDATGSTYAYPYYQVGVLIPTDYSQLILPGTGIVQVTLKWTGGPSEMGLSVDPCAACLPQTFVARPSGTPFNVAIFPNLADPGHQQFSNWLFNLLPSPGDTYYPVAQPAITGGKMTFQIKVFKSVVPLEPAHRDFWGDQTEIVLAKDAPFTFGCIGCNTPYAGYDWAPKQGAFIPPGTQAIQGKLTWTTTGGVSPVNWVLDYKPASVPASQWEKGLKKVPSTPGTNSLTFSFKPDAKDFDQFYQVVSNWQFYMDDQDAGYSTDSASGALAYGASTQFKFSATAVKDPAWADVPTA